MSSGNSPKLIPMTIIWMWVVLILSAVAAAPSFVQQKNVKPVEDKKDSVPADLPNTSIPGPNENPAHHKETFVLQAIFSAPIFCPKGQRLAYGKCRKILT